MTTIHDHVRIERRIDRLDEQMALADAFSEMPAAAIEVITVAINYTAGQVREMPEADRRVLGGFLANVEHVADALALAFPGTLDEDGE